MLSFWKTNYLKKKPTQNPKNQPKKNPNPPTKKPTNQKTKQNPKPILLGLSQRMRDGLKPVLD